MEVIEVESPKETDALNTEDVQPKSNINKNNNNGSSNSVASRQPVSSVQLRNAVLDFLSTKREARKIFEKLDLNKDGTLDVNELRQLFEEDRLNKPDLAYCSKTLIEKGDKNNDGVLDFEEFFEIYQKENLWLKGKVVRYLHGFEQSKSLKDSEILKRRQICKPAFAIIILSVMQVAFYYIEQGGYNLSKIFRFVPFCQGSEIWRYITYMLIHSSKDYLHLWMNIIFQLILGIPLELSHSWWRVLIVYLAGVLAGSFGYSFFKPCGKLVGASAGVYALLAAHLSSSILNWKIKSNAPVHFLVITIFFGVEIFLFFTAGEEANKNVSLVAHAFGAVFGFLMGLCVLKNSLQPATKKKLILIILFYEAFVFAGTLINFITFTTNEALCECKNSTRVK